MRWPHANREEKRVTRGSDTAGTRNIDQEKLASRTPIGEAPDANSI
jgi:hypothetical protein